MIAPPPPLPASPNEPPFWLGDALQVGEHGLELDGNPISRLAQQYETPFYLYSAATIKRRLAELRTALHSAGAPFRIHYAMKANRFLPLLSLLRREGDLGIDACSPREVEHAVAAGFLPSEISVTASMLSNRDLMAFARYGVHLNVDSRSVLRRQVATVGSNRRIGLRIDPAIRVGWGENSKLSYGASKFGFDIDDVLDAAAYANSLGLEVDTLHMHAGWGLQQSAAPQLAAVFAKMAALAAAIPTVHTINVGGGLCSRQRFEDAPLSVQTWAALLKKHLAPTGCTLVCEPGTFVVASCGVLIVTVNTVEVRRSGTYIGIDAGHNINVYPAHYGIPLGIAAVAWPLLAPTVLGHVVGNINEANDIFARDICLPPIAEGDHLALYPAGAYGASMASDHCLRGLPKEVLI